MKFSVISSIKNKNKKGKRKDGNMDEQWMALFGFHKHRFSRPINFASKSIC